MNTSSLYENGRQKALDFDPFLCHETKKMCFVKLRRFFLFLRFTKQSIYTSSNLNGVFMNTFSQNIMHLRPTRHYKHEL